MTLTDCERPLAYRINTVHHVAPWGRSTTYKLAREGALPVRKLGGVTLVLAQDLEDFLAALPLAHPQDVGAASDVGDDEGPEPEGSGQ